jgi:ABC-type lipopolysaccharide export system ATPase subunit
VRAPAPEALASAAADLLPLRARARPERRSASYQAATNEGGPRRGCRWSRSSPRSAAQPTRGLDVGAVSAVYGHIRAARARGAGVLLISSELDELIAVADRILVIYRGRIVGEMAAAPGNREAIGSLMSGHAA